jgi:hypothetical protein
LFHKITFYHQQQQQEQQYDEDDSDPIVDIFITASNIKFVLESGVLSHELNYISLSDYKFALPK